MVSPEAAAPATPLNRYERRLEKKVEKRGRRYLGATAIILALSTIAGYWGDVRINEQAEETAEIGINAIDDPLEDSGENSAVIFLDGFRTYDANIITTALGPGVQAIDDGELWSISYGNAPLDSSEISQKIANLAEEEAIDNVTIVGYSTGGIIGADVMRDLVLDSELIVDKIIPISTPNGVGGLRQSRQEELEILKVVAKIPGAEHSTYLRFLGEMIFRNDRYNYGTIDQRWNNFWHTAREVRSDINEKKFPGTWLIVDQAFAIADADFENTFNEIVRYNTTKPNPVVVNLITEDPYDYMVNNAKSSKSICEAAGKAGLQCFVYDVPGAIHTMPAKSKEAYSATLLKAESAINSAVNKEISLLALRLAVEPGNNADSLIDQYEQGLIASR